MLGVLHKISLGLAPSQLAALFPVVGTIWEPFLARNLRGWMPLHNRQLGTPATPMSSEVMKRSLFGTCRCYNRLPQALVDVGSVKLLQRNLQIGLRKFAQSGSREWHNLFSKEWRFLSRQRFHALFALVSLLRIIAQLGDVYRTHTLCFTNDVRFLEVSYHVDSCHQRNKECGTTSHSSRSALVKGYL